MKKKSWCAALLILTGVWPAGAKAQAVEDTADVFGKEARTAALAKFTALKERTGVELFLETVRTTGENPPGRYALERAREKAVFGAYILIVPEERKIEIKVAGGLKNVLTPELVETYREILVKAFKEREFDEGLLDLAEQVDADLKDTRVERPAPPVAPPATGITPPGRTMILALALLFVSLVMIVRVVLPLVSALKPGPGRR